MNANFTNEKIEKQIFKLIQWNTIDAEKVVYYYHKFL